MNATTRESVLWVTFLIFDPLAQYRVMQVQIPTGLSNRYPLLLDYPDCLNLELFRKDPSRNHVPLRLHFPPYQGVRKTAAAQEFGRSLKKLIQ